MASGKTPPKMDSRGRRSANTALYQGRVYFMRHREIKSPDEHFLIVLNKNPSVDEKIYVAVITSKVGKQEKWIAARNFPQETLVKLSTNDYAELTKPSAISCNNFPALPKPEFESAARGKARKDLPAAILAKIIAGMKKSPMVAKKIKDLIV
ncbi:MAG: hypothetical protein LUI04_04865 [Porphyromonadaceae bacterium]|nr:hypothetical protein [Porphyromonadaceae bacterium]